MLKFRLINQKIRKNKIVKEKNESELTFWDHLDELRATLMRIACVVVVLMLLEPNKGTDSF